MKRFWTAFGTVAMIAILLALPRADAAPSIHFTALNDYLLPLNTGTIPIVRNGSVYIPYSVFRERNIGVSVSSRTSDALVLYGRQKILTFDLTAGNAYDLETTYSAQAVARNGTIYVPAYFVCQYFNLEYSYLTTDYGTVVRMKNLDADLNDNAFVRANVRLMQQYYAAYTGQTSKPTSSTLPTASAVPTGTVRPSPSSYHTPSSAPATPSSSGASPSPSPSESLGSVSIYLGIRVTDQSNTEAFLNWLDTKTRAICFFVSPNELSAQSDLVRRIVGSGYGIGFYLTGTETQLDASLEQGNQLLREIASTTTILLAAPGVDGTQKAHLTQMGYVVFQASEVIGKEGQTTFECSTRMNQIVEEADGKARLLFSDTPQVKTAFSAFMSNRRGIEGNFRRFTETSR